MDNRILLLLMDTNVVNGVQEAEQTVGEYCVVEVLLLKLEESNAMLKEFNFKSFQQSARSFFLFGCTNVA